MAKFNKRRRRYRVEYLDGTGDYEWLDLDANADRVQIFDANRQWAMLDMAYRPALEARRAAGREFKKLKATADRLEEESRYWEVLDAPPAQADPLLFGDDEPPPEERWFNALTGVVRVRDTENAAFWIESRDDRGLFCFENAETGERVYKDPRFKPEADTPDIAAAKDDCLRTLHFATYLVSALLDDYDQADDDKDRSRALNKRLLDNKKVIRDMGAALAAARDLWTREAFDENEQLVFAAHIQHRALDLLYQAELQADQDKIRKRDIIANQNAPAASSAPRCNHEVPQTPSSASSAGSAAPPGETRVSHCKEDDACGAAVRSRSCLEHERQVHARAR